MDRTTLNALHKSIIHWGENLDRISKGQGINTGPSYCALCRMYNKGYKGIKYSINEGNCTGCPVALKSGQDNCNNTPYMGINRPCNETVRAELLYLISLLPTEEELPKEYETPTQTSQKLEPADLLTKNLMEAWNSPKTETFIKAVAEAILENKV